MINSVTDQRPRYAQTHAKLSLTIPQAMIAELAATVFNCLAFIMTVHVHCAVALTGVAQHESSPNPLLGPVSRPAIMDQ